MLIAIKYWPLVHHETRILSPFHRQASSMSWHRWWAEEPAHSNASQSWYTVSLKEAAWLRRKNMCLSWRQHGQIVRPSFFLRFLHVWHGLPSLPFFFFFPIHTPQFLGWFHRISELMTQIISLVLSTPLSCTPYIKPPIWYLKHLRNQYIQNHCWFLSPKPTG